jgi:hypothetical protein
MCNHNGVASVFHTVRTNIVFSYSVVLVDFHHNTRNSSTPASSLHQSGTTAAANGAAAEPMMMHSSSLVAVNGNEGITVDISARNTTNALVPDVHGSNVNITNPHPAEAPVYQLQQQLLLLLLASTWICLRIWILRQRARSAVERKLLMTKSKITRSLLQTMKMTTSFIASYKLMSKYKTRRRCAVKQCIQYSTVQYHL